MKFEIGKKYRCLVDAAGNYGDMFKKGDVYTCVDFTGSTGFFKMHNKKGNALTFEPEESDQWEGPIEDVTELQNEKPDWEKVKFLVTNGKSSLEIKEMVDLGLI